MENTVVLGTTPGNSHGCTGFVVEVLPLTDEIGIVVGGESCSSCWQVGHDRKGSPIRLGSIVRLPLRVPVDTEGFDIRCWSPDAPVLRDGEWITVRDLCGDDPLAYIAGWEMAALPCGYSHNEGIRDRGPQYLGCDPDTGEEFYEEVDPQPDCTLVGPYELELVSDQLCERWETVAWFCRKQASFSSLKEAWGTNDSSPVEAGARGRDAI